MWGVDRGMWGWMAVDGWVGCWCVSCFASQIATDHSSCMRLNRDASQTPPVLHARHLLRHLPSSFYLAPDTSRDASSFYSGPDTSRDASAPDTSQDASSFYPGPDTSRRVPRLQVPYLSKFPPFFEVCVFMDSSFFVERRAATRR